MPNFSNALFPRASTKCQFQPASSTCCTAVNFERKNFIENAIMDRKRAILYYICDEHLDLLEELNETEVKLQETIAALPEAQDLSVVMSTYHSLVENIENMLNDLDELEVRVLRSMN